MSEFWYLRNFQVGKRKGALCIICDDWHTDCHPVRISDFMWEGKPVTRAEFERYAGAADANGHYAIETRSATNPGQRLEIAHELALAKERLP